MGRQRLEREIRDTVAAYRHEATVPGARQVALIRLDQVAIALADEQNPSLERLLADAHREVEAA